MADSYPTTADLTAYLAQAKLQNVATLQLAWAVEAARDEFENAVGYHVLAEDGVRRFDAPRNANGMVDFREPCASVTSVVFEGSPMIEGTDYWLHPNNAPERKRPYRMIEMYKSYPYQLPGLRRTLVITGKWGLSTEVPDDIFQAILARAAILLIPAIKAAISRGLVSWSEAGVQENYGTDPLAFLEEGWKAVYDDVVKRRTDHRAGA